MCRRRLPGEIGYPNNCVRVSDSGPTYVVNPGNSCPVPPKIFTVTCTGLQTGTTPWVSQTLPSDTTAPWCPPVRSWSSPNRSYRHKQVRTGHRSPGVRVPSKRHRRRESETVTSVSRRLCRNRETKVFVQFSVDLVTPGCPHRY